MLLMIYRCGIFIGVIIVGLYIFFVDEGMVIVVYEIIIIKEKVC